MPNVALPPSASPSPEPGLLCSTISSSAGEPLFGTATLAQVWFILEHPDVYGSKALEESQLPAPVKNHLTSLVKATQGSRIQLIKRDPSSFPEQIHFFVALTTEVQPHLYEFQLHNYEEIFDLDIQGIIQNDNEYSTHRREEPLYLVCTNGRRDPCCAKYGLSFNNSLSAQEPYATWQTSHVGGHRFAPNLVSFPYGCFYGRLEEAEIELVLDAHRREQFYIKKFRGRSCFPEGVQAAEYFLHQQSGQRKISSFSLDRSVAIGEDRLEVYFLERAAGMTHRLVIRSASLESEVLTSCRDTEKSRVIQFSLETYQTLNDLGEIGSVGG
jgi:hypothetical protein